MEWNKFLSLVAVFFGLVGSVFLAKGVLLQSPADILGLTSPHSRIGFAPEQIASMAGQKADALVGITMIFLAFLIQILTMIFVEESIGFTEKKWTGVLLAFGLISIVTLTCYLVDIGYREHTRLKIGKLEVKNYFDRYSSSLTEPGRVKGLEGICESLLDEKRMNSESDLGFLKRIANYVEWEIPEDAEFSKVSDLHKKSVESK